MERILAFGCHPDDVEFMAAGALILLAERGYEIHIATMTGGELGTPDKPAEEIRRIRLGEAAQAAGLIGARAHYAGGHDLEVDYNHEYRRKATRILREVDPLIVLTCPPMDYLPDHEMTSLLVRNAAYIASVPRYDCGAPPPPTRRFPYLYYWNASHLTDIFGRRLPVHFGIDVGSAMPRKLEMLACHASQRDWLAFHNGMDAYLDTMKDWTRQQGRQIGREYGECFIQHRGGGHPHDNILKTIFGERCVDLETGKDCT
ncbi:MAG: PIG-L family deacetylase [Lentisphaerae bacterium]|nr:PIG-L family deacetylase [Lentisphaerota bacterium]